jgi:hypothetical protein
MAIYNLLTPGVMMSGSICGAAVVVAAALREMRAPIAAKILIPGVTFALALYAPKVVNDMAGTAKIISYESLPACVNVKAVVPDDKRGVAYLVIDEGKATFYVINVDARVRGALGDAMAALRRGDPAHLCKDKTHNASDQVDGVGATSGMHIDASLFLKHLKEKEND